MKWIPLTTSNQLNEIISGSTNNPILIFKHSTRCGISRMVLKNFEREFNVSEDDITSYYLDLLNFREISNEIAEKLSITHQLPKLIVIKNKVVIHHSSHGDINAREIQEIIA